MLEMSYLALPPHRARVANKMGRHHDGGCRAIGFNCAQGIFGIKPSEDHRRCACRKKTRATQGPVWYMGPTTRWGQAPRAGWLSGYPNAHRPYYPRQTWWGASAFLLDGQLFQRCTRLGLGATETSGSSSLLSASHVDQSVIPSKFVRQPMTTGTPAKCAASMPRSAVSGPTKSMRVPESSRM